MNIGSFKPTTPNCPACRAEIFHDMCSFWSLRDGKWVLVTVWRLTGQEIAPKVTLPSQLVVT